MEILTIVAIILGPIIAVQLTIFLEDRKRKHERKIKLFRTLMATRATTISPDHVQALNMIDVEFFGGKKDKPIIDAWKAYLDILNDKSLSLEQWGLKRKDLFVELLYAMAQGLDYDFDKTHLKNASYLPKGHTDMEDEQTIIRKGLVELFKGTPLPVITTTPQVPADIQKDWDEIRKGFVALLKTKDLKVTIEQEQTKKIEK